MIPRSSRRRHSATLANPAFRVVVLHDDYLSARRGKRLAKAIAEEMGLGERCQASLWNIGLLDTPFGCVAANDTTTADIVILALRSTAGLSVELKAWLARWLTQKRDRSAALIVVLEDNHGPGAKRARAFIDRVAHRAGKDFFSQPADTLLGDGRAEAHELLWVL